MKRILIALVLIATAMSHDADAPQPVGIIFDTTKGNNCFALMKVTISKLSIGVLMSLVFSSTVGAGDFYSNSLGYHKPNAEPVSYPTRLKGGRIEMLGIRTKAR